MEVIGAVGSVVALVETTSILAKSLSTLARRWTHAPEGTIYCWVEAYLVPTPSQ
jgi:hypothetical protein